MHHGTLRKVIVSLVLCAAILLPLVPMNASGAALENVALDGDYKGLKMSVIGDSISTFYGVTNSKTYNPLYLSTSEATFGTYYGNTSHGDYSEFDHITRADTWWQQTVDTLGMDLLVNNAWSGSFILSDNGQSNTTEYPAAAYKTRAVNLHNGSTKPDIIAVYMGTNDVAYYDTRPVGTKANVDTASERSALYTSVNNYTTPSTVIEAYYIMLSRMIATYPDAEIYCMLPSICLNAMGSGRKSALNNFNSGVEYLVDYFAGIGKKVYLVDLNHDAGLVDYDTVRSYYYCNNVHPDAAGMDWITACLISEILEHSTKGNGNSITYPVTYNLSDVFVKEGMLRYAVEGQSFRVTMLPYENYQNVELAVTMTDPNGNTVEIPGLGTSGDQVYIPAVTGPITVTAKADNQNNYHWQSADDAMVSTYGNGLSYNGASLQSGSYDGSTGTGVMTDAYYALEKTTVLQYDKPWVLEFKGGGDTFAGGIILFSETADAATSGNTYIHINQSNVFFGYRDSVGYNNSGITWADVAAKMGSSAGANYRTETHVYRFVNEPNGTANKIRLYVDGVAIGTMDSSKMIGASATHASVGDINISGKDFVFSYMGTSDYPLRNCAFEYIKIWENGELDIEAPEKYDTYRWELNDAGNDFVSLDDDETYTENRLTMLSGSISGGNFVGTSFALDKSILLMHDEPWHLTWESDGTWEDNRGGGMLLATTLNYKGACAPYLYRRPGSGFIAFGEWDNGVHNNYGIMLSDYGIDGEVHHKYELVNDISGERNMIYLYVDDVLVGPMNDYYIAVTNQGVKSDWVSGKDFVFSYFGTSEFTVGGCSIDYIEVKVRCEHRFGPWQIVKDATCLDEGTQSRTCSLCAETEEQTISSTGHNYGQWETVTAATCLDDGAQIHTCSNCGSVEDRVLTATGHSYVDGICGNCHQRDPEYIFTKVTGRSFTLSFEDEVFVNFYFSAEEADGAQLGMLVFHTEPDTVDASSADADYQAVYDAQSNRYMAQTAGISAKQMGDSRYYVAYAKLENGLYVYSKVYDYSPEKYAFNMLSRDSTSHKQKALCVAMLNYGAQAQKYFGYKTDDLMNAALTDEQMALVIDYSSDLFTGAVAVNPQKIGNFGATEQGFTKKTVSVSFDGAFAINYYFTPDSIVDNNITFCYWTPDDYAAVEVLSTNNASGKVRMIPVENGSYWAQITGIAAKEMDETFYVAGFYTSEGVVCSSGVVAYSLSRYCMNYADKPSSEMQGLAAATAVYGYYAQQYFS